MEIGAFPEAGGSGILVEVVCEQETLSQKQSRWKVRPFTYPHTNIHTYNTHTHTPHLHSHTLIHMNIHIHIHIPYTYLSYAHISSFKKKTA